MTSAELLMARVAVAKSRNAEMAAILCEHARGPVRFTHRGHTITIRGVARTSHANKIRLHLSVVGPDGNNVPLDPDGFFVINPRLQVYRGTRSVVVGGETMTLPAPVCDLSAVLQAEAIKLLTAMTDPARIKWQ